MPGVMIIFPFWVLDIFVCLALCSEMQLLENGLVLLGLAAKIC